MKLDVIKRHERGEGTTEIGRTHAIAASTAHSIVQSSAKIKKISQIATSSSATTLTRMRDGAMHNMERLLCVWIEDQTKRRMPLSLAVIQEKARSLWNDLKKKQEAEGKGEGAETFTASRGWFMRFCHRANLHNLKCSGEAASADHAAASEFPAKLKKMIEEGGYSPKQVYNIDETGLFWKRMPSRTYIAREEKTAPGFKAAKDRLTLLLGGNAEGDVKLKPLLVYVCENPRALKGCYLKPQLPVIWRSIQRLG